MAQTRFLLQVTMINTEDGTTSTDELFITKTGTHNHTGLQLASTNYSLRGFTVVNTASGDVHITRNAKTYAIRVQRQPLPDMLLEQ